MSPSYLAFLGIALGAFGGGLLVWVSFIIRRQENENRYRWFTFAGFLCIVLGFVLQTPYYSISLPEWLVAIAAGILGLGFIFSITWFSTHRRTNAHQKGIPNSPDEQIGQPVNLNRDELWRQLGNVIHLRSAQDQVLWSIFGVFWAANAILLVALFPKGHLPTYPVGLIISLVGLFLAVVWHKIQNRALGHVKLYEDLIKKLEEELHILPENAVSPSINKALYEKYLAKGTPARKLMPICSQVMMGLWAFGALIFLILIIVKLACCCLYASRLLPS